MDKKKPKNLYAEVARIVTGDSSAGKEFRRLSELHRRNDEDLGDAINPKGWGRNSSANKAYEEAKKDARRVADDPSVQAKREAAKKKREKPLGSNIYTSAR